MLNNQEETSVSHLRSEPKGTINFYSKDFEKIFRADVKKQGSVFYFRGCRFISKQSNGLKVNDEIRFREVRLIDSQGNMVGVVSLEKAKQMAQEVELDLVLISPSPDNPVCKIMDYGKHMFEQAKREKEAKKKQKVTEVKEIGLKITTEEHDLQVKAKNACRFLQDGDRVKVVIKFRGREMAYTSRGYEVMESFAARCEEFGVIDKKAKIEGRNMVMYLMPNTK